MSHGRRVGGRNRSGPDAQGAKRKPIGRRGSIAVMTAAAAAVAGAAAIALTPSSASAVTKTWNTATAGTFNWSAAANWSGGTQPANGDTANVVPTAVDANNRTLLYDAAATAGATFAGVTVDNPGTGSLTLSLPSGSTRNFSVSGTETIGLNNTATFQQDGGTNTATTVLVVGAATSAVGTYNLTAGTLTGNSQQIASSGTATFNQSGGTSNVSGPGLTDGLLIAVGGVSQSNYNLTGATAAINVTAAGGLIVAKGGTGTLTQTNGAITVGTGVTNRNLIVANDSTAVGTLNASGGTLTVNGNMFVGGSAGGSGGSGSVNITGGTTTVTGTLKTWNFFSSVLLGAGTLNVGSLDNSGIPAAFTWTGGNFNITGAGGVTIGSAGPFGSSYTLTNPLGVTNATTLAADGQLTINGGSLTTGTLVSGGGTINFTSGALTITGGGLTVDNGQPLGAFVNLDTLSTLSTSATLANNAQINLAGGKLAGAGALSNSGIISGFGTITGSGGFINSGALQQGDGNITLTKTGTNTNTASGLIMLKAGRQLQLNAVGLANNGEIDLNGGMVTSSIAATLSNNSEGLITGSGTISSLLSNSGTIAVPSGNLNVSAAFTNTGVISLGGIDAKLTVGGNGLNNSGSGVVSGVGRVGGSLNNTGTIEASGGGTLVVAGALGNAAGGVLTASAGNELLLSGPPGANSGVVSLTGGTFDTNKQLYTNSAGGVISGRGAFRFGALTNNGQVLLSSGTSDVLGAVTGTSGSKVILSASATANFYNAVTMNAGSEFRVGGGSTAVFFGNVTGASFFTGAGVKDFESSVASVGSLITPGSSIVQNGATLTASVVRESSLYLSGSATITPSGTFAAVSDIGTLTIPAPTGKLDLKNNSMVLRGNAIGSWTGSSYSGVLGLVASGFNGGLQNGSGIVTTQSAAVSPNSLTALGVASADQLGLAGATWKGLNIESGNVLVMYTYGGDANLDGVVNGDDYFQIDSAFPAGLKGWINGDFNYDGVVNGDDYFVIDSNFPSQGAAFQTSGGLPGAAALAGVTSVPEPMSLSTLGLAAASVVARRRRRR